MNFQFCQFSILSIFKSLHFDKLFLTKEIRNEKQIVNICLHSFCLSLQTLSSFSADSNGKLNSGPITILDATSFYIRNLRLYIEEPGYHFWVGNSSFMTPNRDGFMVANDKA